MKTISMERVRELDKIWARESSACLQQGKHYPGPSPFFIQEKYLDATDLTKMAKKWGVSLEELRTYVTVQRYINAAANDDCEDLPFPEDAAGLFGIPLAEFNDYLHMQMKLIHDAREIDEDDIADWRDVAAEDFGAEEDILQDAALQGE